MHVNKVIYTTLSHLVGHKKNYLVTDTPFDRPTHRQTYPPIDLPTNIPTDIVTLLRTVKCKIVVCATPATPAAPALASELSRSL